VTSFAHIKVVSTTKLNAKMLAHSTFEKLCCIRIKVGPQKLSEGNIFSSLSVSGLPPIMEVTEEGTSGGEELRRESTSTTHHCTGLELANFQQSWCVESIFQNSSSSMLSGDTASHTQRDSSDT